MLIGSFPSWVGFRRWTGREKDVQWHDAVTVGGLEAVLSISSLLPMIARENGQLRCVVLSCILV